MPGAPANEDLRDRCRRLLEEVRAGETDPSSAAAQQVLFAGLMRGFIRRDEADEAADAYWAQRLGRVLEQVERGDADPRHPEVAGVLDWGVQTGQLTKARRRQAEKAFGSRR